jgi:pilus assembly protein CpaE
MHSSGGVFLMTDDAQTDAEVSDALKSSRRLGKAAIFKDMAELAAAMERSPAPAVVVDLGINASKTLSELGHVASRFPQTRFVVIADKTESDLMLRAMEAGARHFLLRDRIAAELAKALHRLVPDAINRITGRGTLVVVLSAGGGCGATTIAVNLAHELHLANKEPTLLVDMDLAYGSAATYLGLSGTYSLADVLAYNGSIDSHLVTSTSVVHPQGIHVLLSPATISYSQAAKVDFARLDEVIQACASAYRCTVFDAPRLPIDVAAALARASKQTLVVFQLAVTDLRVARAMNQALAERGVKESQIMPVANRYRKGHTMITLDEAVKCIGRNSFTAISNDFACAAKAVNYGQMFNQASVRSTLTRDVRELAARISAGTPG